MNVKGALNEHAGPKTHMLAGEEFVKARPSDVGAPSFLRVDIANKEITGPEQATPIKFVERNDMQSCCRGPNQVLDGRLCSISKRAR